MRRSQQHFARVQVRRGGAVVRQLQRGQRAVRVHLVAHQRQRGDVAVVPQPRLHVRREVAAGVDLAFLGGDHRPAALGLDLAHRRVGERHRVAHAIAMRHLEEAVLGRHRADLQRGEQDVVAGVAHGWNLFCGCRWLASGSVCALAGEENGVLGETLLSDGAGGWALGFGSQSMLKICVWSQAPPPSLPLPAGGGAKCVPRAYSLPC